MLAELAVALAASACFAPRADSLTLQSGTGNEVHVAGLGWETPLAWGCLGSDRPYAGLLFRLDEWHGHRREGRDVADASVTPFLRYELGRPLAMPIYGELGIGAHLLSRTRIDYERRFSTAFQFGEFAGLAMSFGDHRQYEIGARIQHVSNGGIKRPNDGLTYEMLFFNLHF
jgi:lipid A 3-O-deacylase